jgi:hypothetical protein
MRIFCRKPDDEGTKIEQQAKKVYTELSTCSNRSSMRRIS